MAEKAILNKLGIEQVQERETEPSIVGQGQPATPIRQMHAKPMILELIWEK